MRTSRSLVAAVALMSALALPAVAGAQGRGRAVPRGSVLAARPPVTVVRPSRPAYRPYVRSYYYGPYRPGVSLGLYFGSRGYIGPYAYRYGFPYAYDYGYDPFRSYGYRYPYRSYGYAGVYPGYAARATGGVRLDLPQRDAEVYVDGYYTGVVDDFDGTGQRATLEPGPHHIEIRLDGFEPVEFDVNVERGRTITYRSSLREARP